MIVRGPRPKHGYLLLSNSVARDTRLSFRARGVLVCVLSMPDNYQVSAEFLRRLTTGEGREAIRTALDELRQRGYARTVKVRAADGKIRTVTYVFDSPHPAGHVMDNVVDNDETGAQETDAGYLGAFKTTDVKGLVDSPKTRLLRVLDPCGQCDGTGWRPTETDELVRCDHG